MRARKIQTLVVQCAPEKFKHWLSAAAARVKTGLAVHAWITFDAERSRVLARAWSELNGQPLYGLVELFIIGFLDAINHACVSSSSEPWQSLPRTPFQRHRAAHVRFPRKRKALCGGAGQARRGDGVPVGRTGPCMFEKKSLCKAALYAAQAACGGATVSDCYEIAGNVYDACTWGVGIFPNGSLTEYRITNGGGVVKYDSPHSGMNHVRDLRKRGGAMPDCRKIWRSAGRP